MTKETKEVFKLHDIDSAPEKSKKHLENAKKSYGYIPNLHAVLAESPSLLEAYLSIHNLFVESLFDNDELTVVWQTINVEHECKYCVPGHTAIAKAMKVDDAIINALRNRTALPTEKLQVLHNTTLLMTRNRGYLSQQEIQDFFKAGYTKRHLLEIILGLSQKVISNYTNHIAETPLDKSFQKYSWDS